MLCPRCGTASLPDDKFCKSCGSPLTAAASAQPVSVPAPLPVSAPAAKPVPPPPPAPQPLHAIPVGGFTTDDVVAWLQSAGYAAKVVMGDSGKPHVSSFTQGTPFHVFMHDCQGDRCASVRFAAGFATHGKFDISQMNDWNVNARWCRGYYDSVNDPWLEMDVDLHPGGTYESLNDQFAAWDNTLARFIKKYSLL